MKAVCLGIFAGLLLASCSSYQKDFRNTSLTKPSPTPTGAWKGTWKSEVNGHHGPLWCLVSQAPNDPHLWDFRYRAGWGILQFGDYTHRIRTTKKNNTLSLNHSMTLPKNFGTYRVIGKVTPSEFTTTYQGSGDKGTMTLTRP